MNKQYILRTLHICAVFAVFAIFGSLTIKKSLSRYSGVVEDDKCYVHTSAGANRTQVHLVCTDKTGKIENSLRWKAACMDERRLQFSSIQSICVCTFLRVR